MAFVLKRHKSVGSQLRRLVAGELHGALATLSDSASVEIAVHDARTNVKKVRAVVRVLHDDLESGDRDRERLRQIAHRLSSLRDADATGETLQQLRGRYPRVVTGKMVREIARGLERRNRQVRARGRRLIGLATGELGRLSKSLPERVQEAGRFKAVRRGVTRGWRRASRAMKGLDVSSDAARFHLWRRRVKTTGTICGYSPLDTLPHDRVPAPSRSWNAGWATTTIWRCSGPPSWPHRIDLATLARPTSCSAASSSARRSCESDPLNSVTVCSRQKRRRSGNPSEQQLPQPSLNPLHDSAEVIDEAANVCEEILGAPPR